MFDSESYQKGYDEGYESGTEYGKIQIIEYIQSLSEEDLFKWLNNLRDKGE